jgi:phospholipase/carboxylesterase
MSVEHSHATQPVLSAGELLSNAQAGMILLHGRGGTADGILRLARMVFYPGFAYLAPQAASNTWYPRDFMSPVEMNEPWLSAALQKISALLERFREARIPPERVILLGFSQGACLVAEYALRNPQRYGGIVILSGGLIGAQIALPDTDGSLAGTPILLACSDLDPFIPLERVEETAAVLRGLGGNGDRRIFPGLGHTVNEEELGLVHALMASVPGVPEPGK